MGFYYMKKNLMGLYKITKEEEAEQMMWKLEDGKDFIAKANELIKLKKTHEVLKEDKKVLEEEKENLTEQISSLETKKADLEKKIEVLENYLNREKRKNQHLVRICKEKANADRNLSPRKKHSGYIEVSKELVELSLKVKETTGFGAGERTVYVNKTFKFWKYHVQTPYLKSLEYDIFWNLLLNDFSLKKIMLENLSNFNPKEICLYSILIYNLSPIARLNSNYWEIKFFTKEKETISL